MIDLNRQNFDQFEPSIFVLYEQQNFKLTRKIENRKSESF